MDLTVILTSKMKFFPFVQGALNFHWRCLHRKISYIWCLLPLLYGKWWSETPHDLKKVTFNGRILIFLMIAHAFWHFKMFSGEINFSRNIPEYVINFLRNSTHSYYALVESWTVAHKCLSMFYFWGISMEWNITQNVV